MCRNVGSNVAVSDRGSNWRQLEKQKRLWDETGDFLCPAKEATHTLI